jgi:hypothetical protein
MMAVLLPLTCFAEIHPLQQQVEQQLAAAEATQEAAAKATAGVRQKLIGEHMQMLRQALQQMEEAKPQAGVSVQEHDEWIAEHQKLMDEVLQQMIKDQELLAQDQNLR